MIQLDGKICGALSPVRQLLSHGRPIGFGSGMTERQIDVSVRWFVPFPAHLTFHLIAAAAALSNSIGGDHRSIALAKLVN